MRHGIDRLDASPQRDTRFDDLPTVAVPAPSRHEWLQQTAPLRPAIEAERLYGERLKPAECRK
jgi:hypothetical protein